MQARNFTTNVPKILDLKSSSQQIFFRKLSLGAPVDCRIRGSASAAIRRRLKTSRQIYKQIFALKEFSQSNFFPSEKGFTVRTAL